MVLGKDIHELLRKFLRYSWIAIGNVSDKIDQFSQRNDSGISGSRWRCHKNLSMALILVVLSPKVLDIRPEYRALMLTAYKIQKSTKISGAINSLGISANFML